MIGFYEFEHNYEHIVYPLNHLNLNCSMSTIPAKVVGKHDTKVSTAELKVQNDYLCTLKPSG